MRYPFLLLCAIGFAAWAQDSPQAAQAPPASPETVLFEDVTVEDLKGLEEYWLPEAEQDTPGALSLTLRDCVTMTLERNPQVLVAQDEVDAAAARVGQARSRMRPQVKAQESYTYIPDMDSGGGGVLSIIMPGGLQGEDTVRRDALNISQTLYAGGRIRAAVDAAQYLAQSQEWQKQAQLNGLEFEAKRAYYTCLLARALTRVAENSVTTFSRHLSDTQQMLEVGLVSQFEVLRAKTELGSRQADLVATRNAQRIAMLNLTRVLALPQDSTLRLVDTLPVKPVGQSLQESIVAAHENRPELLALNKGIDAAKARVKAAKGQYWPSAAATADWVNADGGGQFMRDGWTLTVGAEWDLYAGGRRKSEVLEAEAGLRNLGHQKEDLLQLVELDVRQAYIRMQDAVAKVRQEKGTVELAREGQRLAELRYQEGVGTQSETLDAELALTSAESSLERALFEYAVAGAALEKATGRSWVSAANVPSSDAKPAEAKPAAQP